MASKAELTHMLTEAYNVLGLLASNAQISPVIVMQATEAQHDIEKLLEPDNAKLDDFATLFEIYKVGKEWAKFHKTKCWHCDYNMTAEECICDKTSIAIEEHKNQLLELFDQLEIDTSTFVNED